MNFHIIKEVRNLKGKRVLVRVDFNVPIVKSSVHSSQFTVGDDSRIVAAVPTLKWLTKKGARVIVATHFGRPPSGKHGSKETRKHSELVFIAKRLGELLRKNVAMVEEWDFGKIGKALRGLKAGGVLMLPNLRLNPGEEANDAEFAKALASTAQVYVNEAFSVCHRKHASIVGVPKFLPSYAGLRLSEEVEILSGVRSHPHRPLVVLIGGAKITDKIGVIRHFLNRASAVLVGGASANHFFKAMGYGVGASPIEMEGVRMARALLKNHRHGGAGKKIVLPKDVVIGKPNGTGVKVVEVSQRPKPYTLAPKPYAILDIGPRTITHFSHWIRAARTLIWNGPMGAYERKEFSYGTLALAQLFAARARGRAFGVIGGGETIDAVRQTGMLEYVDFVSVGGGAMLEFLSGKTLPGLEALYAR